MLAVIFLVEKNGISGIIGQMKLWRKVSSMIRKYSGVPMS